MTTPRYWCPICRKYVWAIWDRFQKAYICPFCKQIVQVQ